jgi:hypothetical protein
MLLVLIALSSVGSVIYWTSYHAYVAVAGDAANRGSQIGMVEALSAVASVVAPALMAVLLLTGGPAFAFGVIAIVQMLAALPLVGAPRMLVPAVVGDDFRARRFGMRLFFADGWAFGCMHLLWQIVLFVTLGEQIAAYGGTMALAGLFGAGMSLTFGLLIDLGHGKHSAAIAYGGAAIAASAMLLSYATPVAAIAAAALGAIVGAVQRPTILACVYNVAQRSSCPLRFHMASEAGWDLGSAASCLISAALIWFGAPIGAPIALAFAGLGASCFMLRASYAEQARLGHV